MAGTDEAQPNPLEHPASDPIDGSQLARWENDVARTFVQGLGQLASWQHRRPLTSMLAPEGFMGPMTEVVIEELPDALSALKAALKAKTQFDRRDYTTPDSSVKKSQPEQIRGFRISGELSSSIGGASKPRTFDRRVWYHLVPEQDDEPLELLRYVEMPAATNGEQAAYGKARNDSVRRGRERYYRRVTKATNVSPGGAVKDTKRD